MPPAAVGAAARDPFPAPWHWPAGGPGSAADTAQFTSAALRYVAGFGVAPARAAAIVDTALAAQRLSAPAGVLTRTLAARTARLALAPDCIVDAWVRVTPLPDQGAAVEVFVEPVRAAEPRVVVVPSAACEAASATHLDHLRRRIEQGLGPAHPML